MQKLVALVTLFGLAAPPASGVIIVRHSFGGTS
jgi:hypothetical protein